MQQKNIEVLLPNIVKNVVSHSLGLDYNQTANLTSDTNLIKELGADSLDITDIVIQVQGKTGKILTPNQEAYLYEIIYDNPTIGTIINFIANPIEAIQTKTFSPTEPTPQKHQPKETKNPTATKTTFVFPVIRDILAQHFDKPESKITLKTHLINDMEMDDLDSWELLYKIEDKLNLSFNFKISQKPLVSELVKQIIKQRKKEHTDKGKVITRIITNLKSNLFNKQTNISK